APLRVKFALPELYLDQVRKGTKPLVVPSANPGEVHDGRIIFVSPVVDPASDTIDVTAELRGPVANLHPGMTVNISLLDPQGTSPRSSTSRSPTCMPTESGDTRGFILS